MGRYRRLSRQSIINFIVGLVYQSTNCCSSCLLRTQGARLISRAHFNSVQIPILSGGRVAAYYSIDLVYERTWRIFTCPSPLFSRCHQGCAVVPGQRLRDVKGGDVFSVRASPAAFNGLPRSRCTDVGMDACGRTPGYPSNARNLSLTSTQSSGRRLDNGFSHGCEQTLSKTGYSMWLEWSRGFRHLPSFGPEFRQ